MKVVENERLLSCLANSSGCSRGDERREGLRCRVKNIAEGARSTLRLETC